MPIEDYIGDLKFYSIKCICTPNNNNYKKKLDKYKIHGNKKFKNFYEELKNNHPLISDFILYKLSLLEEISTDGNFMIAHNINNKTLRYYAAGDSPNLNEAHRNHLLHGFPE